uniref:Uncharacterized protein n=1 Tax=Ditylenchus dipsaci TaxID=166011 RepID=A0A915CVT9_9BILA
MKKALYSTSTIFSKELKMTIHRLKTMGRKLSTAFSWEHGKLIIKEQLSKYGSAAGNYFLNLAISLYVAVKAFFFQRSSQSGEDYKLFSYLAMAVDIAAVGQAALEEAIFFFSDHLERAGSVFNHEAIREHHPYAFQIATLEEELKKSHIDHFSPAELRMTDRPKPAEATVFGQ